MFADYASKMKNQDSRKKEDSFAEHMKTWIVETNS